MPLKKVTKATKAAPVKKASPKKKGTAATREARRWLEECGSDSDDTSDGHGPVPQQAGGATSNAGVMGGEQHGSAMLLGGASSHGVGVVAAVKQDKLVAHREA